tara:strand:+ start:106 stop:285 length:180 start_codon:yes stop_codon:yes gene_type:complete
MANLKQKIMKIHPSLTDADFFADEGTIELQNNSDGKGDFISKWEHPSLSKPTDEQLEDS